MTATRPKLPLKRAFSAGGVVYRCQGDSVQVVICGQRNSGVWGLAKGTPQRGERLEETAIREVEEETGLQVAIVDKIGSIQYWFVEEGVRYFKTVYYYLMRPIGGDIANHDPEFDEVRWCDLPEAPDLLTYKNDAEIVRRAAEMIRQRGLEGSGV